MRTLLVRLIALSCATIVLCLGHATVRAQSEPADVKALVEHVMTQLVKTKKGLRVGMSTNDALEELGSAAHVVGTYALPLGDTPYALGDWKGTVYVYHLDEESERLDELHVAVLCGEFDRNALAAHVIATGTTLGHAMELVDEEDGLYWDVDKDPSLCVSLAGKGVLLFEMSMLGD